MAKRKDPIEGTTVAEVENGDTIDETVEENGDTNKSTADPQKPKTETMNPGQEMVELFVERDTSDENTNLVIGINGKNWVLPRGEYSKVPRFVAEEYERAKRAQYKADKTVAQMRGIKAAN